MRSHASKPSAPAVWLRLHVLVLHAAMIGGMAVA